VERLRSLIPKTFQPLPLNKMSLLEESVQAIHNVHSLCVNMKNAQPDVYSLLGIQADLLKLHTDLGQEMAHKFGAKESAYIGRKIAEANQYVKGRQNPAKKIADVNQDSLLAVKGDCDREIEAAVTYERYRTLLKSLQNSLDYARTVVSFLKTSESHS
jgi:hypothetical protein